MAQSLRATRSDAGQARSIIHTQVLRDFGGMNTQAARQAIGDNEFAWLENVMPIGHGNAAFVAGPGPAIASGFNGTIYQLHPFNRAGANFMFVATTTGHAYEVALDGPFTKREITNPTTPEFGGSLVFIDQWKNERIMIVDPAHGLFDWDGTTLRGPGQIVSVTVTAGGVYTAIPAVSFGGPGSGAAAQAVVGINGTQTVTAGGTNYSVGDILTFAGGGTFTTAAQVKVTTIGAGGAVTAVSVFVPGAYTALLGAPVSTVGGTGSGCTITPSYAVFSVNVTAPGNGYTTAPTVSFTAGTTATAAATANITGAPVGPGQVACFGGRVWVAAGRLLAWSAPNTYNDFVGPGSGSKIITDSTLNSAISFLRSANNFLYYGGINSINIIGDVQVNSNGDTVFSDTNLSADVGTLAAQTVCPYLRQLLLMNSAGVYSVSGATPQKISDAMDGFFEDIDFNGTISGGTFIMKGQLCAAFSVLYNNTGLPSTAATSRALLIVYFNRKWFVANQDAITTRITIVSSGTQNNRANPQIGFRNLYATDGASLYQLFADPASPVSWKMQTRLWDMQHPEKGKEVNAIALEVNGTTGTVSGTVDMLQKETPYFSQFPFSMSLDPGVTWVNNSGAAVPWQNNTGLTVEWEASDYVLDMQEAEGFGKYVGLTFQSSSVTGSISSAMLGYALREDW